MIGKTLRKAFIFKGLKGIMRIENGLSEVVEP